MFDGIRKHQKLLQFALLLLILPAFVFFGVSGYQRENKEQSVAKVGDATISTREYNEALQRQLDQIRQMTGGQTDVSQFDTPEARKQLLESLIARKALEQHSINSNISVSRKAVFDALNNIPTLKKADGTFDDVRYKALLQAQGQTPEMFEAQFSKDLSSGIIIEALSQSALGSSAVADKVATLTEQVRVAKLMSFKTADFAPKVLPTDEQIKTYFDKNQALFKTEESAKVEYLVLNADAVAGQVKLNPEDVKTFYEQNKQRFGTKEQRRASHIFFEAAKSASDSVKKTAKAKADAALAAVQKDPAKFADLAKTLSQDAGSADKGGDLGFFAKDGIVAAVADAAWALKDNEVSPVVESEDGFHVVKLTGVQAGDVKPFDAVKAEIEADLKRQQSTKLFSESAEGFTNSVYEQADSLKAAADKYKLVVQTAQGLSRNAPQPGAGAVLSNPKLLKAIFSDDALTKKRNTEAIEVAPGTLVSARVVEYTPSAVRPLEQVKPVVVLKIQGEEGKKQAIAAGEAKLKELVGGASGTFTDTSITVSRVVKTELDKASVDAIFRASESKLPAYVGAKTDSGYNVFQVVEVKAGEGKEVEGRKAQLQGRVDGVFQQQEFVAFTDNLKSRFKVSRKEAAILKQDK
jgi:peptidyl-prolyl cis-trans isomerase D